jgi:hypothetical protein
MKNSEGIISSTIERFLDCTLSIFLSSVAKKTLKQEQILINYYKFLNNGRLIFKAI